MKEKRTNNTWRIIGVLGMIGLIILAFVLFVDMQAVGRQLRTADFRYLLAGATMLLAGLVTYALRWRLLLAYKPGRIFTFHASNIGHALNIIIPFRAGEPARIIIMGRNGDVSVTEATSSFVVERMFEQIMRLVALGLAVMVGTGLALSARAIAGGLFFVVLIALVISWLTRHRETVLEKGPPLLAKLPRVSEEGARNSLADMLNNLEQVSTPRQLSLALFWSFLSWSFYFAFFYLTMQALQSSFTTTEALSISLGALALSPPSAPTQPGIFHASVVVPLTAVGFNSEQLTAYAVLLHAVEMVLMIGLALWASMRINISARSLLKTANS